MTILVCRPWLGRWYVFLYDEIYQKNGVAQTIFNISSVLLQRILFDPPCTDYSMPLGEAEYIVVVPLVCR